MKRTRVASVAVVGAVAAAACHQVVIRVERKSSVGIVHTSTPEPKLNAYDGHVIGLPALAPVNCYDVIRVETDKTGKRKADALNVFSEDFETCSRDDFTANFAGYWSPWPHPTDAKQRPAESGSAGSAAGGGSESTDHVLDEPPPATRAKAAAALRQRGPLLDALKQVVCKDRDAEICNGGINYASSPAWYRRSVGNQRVEAAWILDEYQGWSPAIDARRYKVMDVVDHPSTDKKRVLVLDHPPDRLACQVVRKVIDPDSELVSECGTYGYAVMSMETRTLPADQLVISQTQVSREKAACPHSLATRLEIVQGDEVIVEPCPDPQTVLSFVHLSDAQIREPNAKLANREASKQLDKYVSSFEHDYEQDLFSPFFYEAMIETINKEIVAANAVQSQVRAAVALAPADPSRPDDSSSDLYRAPPSFMIHTGDSVDAGLASEFRYFVDTSNRLTIPWYQVIGNHDVLAFGNLKLGNARQPKSERICTGVSDLLLYAKLREPVNNDNEKYRLSTMSWAYKLAIRALPKFATDLCLDQSVIGDDFVARPDLDGETPRDAFMRAHCVLDRFDRCKLHLKSEGRACTATGYRRRMHGFQACTADAQSPDQTTPISYYAFAANLVTDPTSGTFGQSGYTVDLDGPGGDRARRVWVVVLDTASDQGAYGVMDERQLRWLDQLLADEEGKDSHIVRRGDLVMMFAHHPVWSLQDDATRRRVESLIARSGNVIAFFAGHTHSPGLRAVPYSTGKDKRVLCDGTKPCAYWEVIAPSLIEFPQQGRQVTLKWLTNSLLGYFDILAFAPQLTAEGEADVDRAMKGAERDLCVQHPDSCANDRPKGVRQEHMYSRLFFRLPANKPRPTTARVCRPFHVQLPTGTNYRNCDDPCAGVKGCVIPKSTPYFTDEDLDPVAPAVPKPPERERAPRIETAE